MKSALLMLKVEATRPPTSTCAEAPNSTPLGFRTKTCPLALRLPSIWLGFCPVTRLSAIDAALGWLKRTASLLPMLKFCQLMARFWLLWVMVVVVPAWTIAPVPALICPPVGSACARGARRTAPERNNKAITKKLRPNIDLLDPLMFSITDIQTLMT